MNFSSAAINVGEFGAFGTFAIVLGLVQLIVWVVIAWRAMRAHEEIASSLDSLARHIRQRDERPVTKVEPKP